MRGTIGPVILGVVLVCSASSWAGEPGPINPDRPGKNSSPATVPQGLIQFEVGLYDESFQRRSGVTIDAGSAGAAVAKYGLTDRLDLEAGMALFQFQRTHDAGGDQTIESVGDFFLHAKYNPLAGEGSFALALAPFVKLPTAGRLGNGAVEGGLLAPMTYDLGDTWSLASTPEADILKDASGGGYHAALLDALGLGRGFGPLTVGAELWTSQDLDPAGTVGQYSFGMAAAWLANNDTQLDLGFDLGLNRATPDFEAYAGVSWRF